MTAMITWAEGVISMREPLMISELCSASGGMIGAGLVFPLSSCHTTDGLKSLSTKVLGGVVLSTHANKDVRCLITLSGHVMKLEPQTELTF